MPRRRFDDIPKRVRDRRDIIQRLVMVLLVLVIWTIIYTTWKHFAAAKQPASAASRSRHE